MEEVKELLRRRLAEIDNERDRLEKALSELSPSAARTAARRSRRRAAAKRAGRTAGKRA